MHCSFSSIGSLLFTSHPNLLEEVMEVTTRKLTPKDLPLVFETQRLNNPADPTEPPKIRARLYLKIERIHEEATLVSTRHDNAEEMCDAINRQLGVDVFKSDVIRPTRIRTQNIPKGCWLELHDGLHYILGFKESRLSQNGLLSEYDIQPDRGVFSAILYSNLVRSSLVGDIYAPVIRVLPLKKSQYGDVVYHSLFDRQYRQLAMNEISDIEIEICDVVGRRLELGDSSHVLLTLHFKKA